VEIRRAGVAGVGGLLHELAPNVIGIVAHREVGEMGTNASEEGRLCLNPVCHPVTMTACGLVNGNSYEPEPVKGNGLNV
jgi:hypothetical protein